MQIEANLVKSSTIHPSDLTYAFLYRDRSRNSSQDESTKKKDKQEDAIESFVNKEKSPSGTFIEESLSGDLGDSVS